MPERLDLTVSPRIDYALPRRSACALSGMVFPHGRGLHERMESFWLIAYLILAFLTLVQSVLLGLQAWEHRRYGRSCMRGLSHHRPQGRLALFAPCKGIDVDLAENLRALLSQDYDDYEVTFVVESGDDPAAAVIREVMAEHPRVAARLVVAGISTSTGQKVHNLRAATADLAPDVQYLAFIDSDARPRPQWLRVLAARLQDDAAAVTGYRWFLPERNTIANLLLYSLNSGVMALLGRSSYYLVWGGSWGIRRETFDRIGLRAAWEGTISDDLIATRELRAAKVHVRFDPVCVVASPLDGSLRDVWSFVRRQYFMGRFHVPDWWVLAMAAATFNSLVWLGSLAALAWSLLGESLPWWIPGSTMALAYATTVFRGRVRQDLIETFFPDHKETLRVAARFDIWASPLAGLIGWPALLGSLFSRHVTWRGIHYRLLPGGKTLIVHRDAPATVSLMENRKPRPRTKSRELPPYRKAG